MSQKVAASRGAGAAPGQVGRGTWPAASQSIDDDPAGAYLPARVRRVEREAMVTRVFGWLACVGSVVLLIVAMVTGTSPATAAGTRPAVTGASIRLAVVPGRPAAGYFAVTAGTQPVTLTAVTSPVARIELHAMTMTGGIMRMGRLRALPVAAGTTVRLTPGGTHLMVFDLPATVVSGATLPLTFVFADGRQVSATAAVLPSLGAAASPAMPAMSPVPGAH